MIKGTNKKANMKDIVKIIYTKSGKFRAIIKEFDSPKYEVTIGGKSWKEGKGIKHKKAIFMKIRKLLNNMLNELKTIEEN